MKSTITNVDKCFAPSNIYETVMKPWSNKLYKYSEDDLLWSLGLTKKDFGSIYRDCYIFEDTIIVLVRFSAFTRKEFIKIEQKMLKHHMIRSTAFESSDNSYIQFVFNRKDTFGWKGHRENSVEEKYKLAETNKALHHDKLLLGIMKHTRSAIVISNVSDQVGFASVNSKKFHLVDLWHLVGGQLEAIEYSEDEDVLILVDEDREAKGLVFNEKAKELFGIEYKGVVLMVSKEWYNCVSKNKVK